MLRKRSEMERHTLEKCHDGIGALQCVLALDGRDGTGNIQFVHDDVIPPGATIGVHCHEGNEEIYLVLEGRGTMILDGRECQIGPGDISFCASGHSHGLVNDSGEPIRMIVVGVRCG